MGFLLTAAPHAVPPALFEQLAVGGRLIAPVGPEGRQELYRYTKGETRIERQSLGTVSFRALAIGIAALALRLPRSICALVLCCLILGACADVRSRRPESYVVLPAGHPVQHRLASRSGFSRLGAME